MIRLTAPLIGFALMSCSPPPPPRVIPAPPQDAPKPQPTTCGAEKVGQFVGQKRSDAISREVARLSGAQSIRWISPGMAVTMDYREDRLNVALDDKDVITRFYCS